MSEIDSVAFAIALKESRRLADEASFHDAVHVERYSRPLPVWTPASFVDGETVPGTWLAGGAPVSVLGSPVGALTGLAMFDSAFAVRDAASLSAKEGKPRMDQRSLDEAVGALPATGCETQAGRLLPGRKMTGAGDGSV